MDSIHVVTVSRQTGSLGSEVSRLAAGQLGFKLVWREVINKAAMRAGSPEAALAAIDDLGMLGICPSPQACQAYRKSVEALMHEYAGQGQIMIIGRAGQMILKDRPDALHVRITAPLEARVRRLVERHSITPEAALAQIEASDSYRKKYMKRFYHCRWDDPDLYDLTLNTGRLSAEEAASLITQTVRLSHVESPLLNRPTGERPVDAD